MILNMLNVMKMVKITSRRIIEDNNDHEADSFEREEEEWKLE